MADAKLNDLIEALKRQGVESGEEAARRIEAEAETRAQAIVEEAKQKAQALLAAARSEADIMQKKLQSSLEIAASQFVVNLKKTLERDLLILPLHGQLKAALADPAILAKLLQEFVSAYAAGKPDSQLALLLPEGTQDELIRLALSLAGQAAGATPRDGRLELAQTSSGVRFGFLVNLADGTTQLDFSDEAFLALFLRYLSPRFQKLFPSAAPAKANAR